MVAGSSSLPEHILYLEMATWSPQGGGSGHLARASARCGELAAEGPASVCTRGSSVNDHLLSEVAYMASPVCRGSLFSVIRTKAAGQEHRLKRLLLGLSPSSVLPSCASASNPQYYKTKEQANRPKLLRFLVSFAVFFPESSVFTLPQSAPAQLAFVPCWFLRALICCFREQLHGTRLHNSGSGLVRAEGLHCTSSVQLLFQSPWRGAGPGVGGGGHQGEDSES